jgi:hypothetical protein
MDSSGKPDGGLVSGIAVIAFIVAAFWLLVPATKPSRSQIEEYERFRMMALRGRITSLDDGRGLKIKVDDQPGWIRMPGTRFQNGDTAFQWNTGQNLGDSLIKEAGNDTFYVVTREHTFLGIAVQ